VGDTYRFVKDGTDYAIKALDLVTGQAVVQEKGLSLFEARCKIAELRPKREHGDRLVHGIVWTGKLWEDAYEEVKL
jgi:hypothetical protein